MAFPTLPEQVVVESYLFVAKIGSTVLGQVRDVQAQSQSTVRQHPRIGDIDQARTVGPKSHTVTVELYADGTLLELARLLNQYPSGGTWVGTEQLKMDPSLPAFDLIVEQYDTTGATAALLSTQYMINFQANQLTRNITADSVVMHSLQGACDTIYITHVAT